MCIAAPRLSVRGFGASHGGHRATHQIVQAPAPPPGRCSRPGLRSETAISDRAAPELFSIFSTPARHALRGAEQRLRVALHAALAFPAAVRRPWCRPLALPRPVEPVERRFARFWRSGAWPATRFDRVRHVGAPAGTARTPPESSSEVRAPAGWQPCTDTQAASPTASRPGITGCPGSPLGWPQHLGAHRSSE